MEQKQRRINSATYFFIVVTAVCFLATVLINLLYTKGIIRGIEVKLNIVISQSLILIPIIVYFIITKRKFTEVVRLKKTHPLMIIIVPIIAFAIIPLMTVINALSMLVVDNRVSDVASVLVQKNSYGVALFFIALIPAIIEELAYRGIVLGNYIEGSRLSAIVLSGFLFGIMHMNFNQMAYAFVLGIIFGFLLEATGSILSTMLVHFCINGTSISLTYLANKLAPLSEQLEKTELTDEALLQSVKIYAPLAVVGLVIAASLIFVLAMLNNRKDYFISIFKRTPKQFGEKKARIATLPFIIIVIVCIGICIIDEFVL